MTVSFSIVTYTHCYLWFLRLFKTPASLSKTKISFLSFSMPMCQSDIKINSFIEAKQAYDEFHIFEEWNLLDMTDAHSWKLSPESRDVLLGKGSPVLSFSSFILPGELICFTARYFSCTGFYIKGAIPYLFLDAWFLLLSITLARRVQVAHSVAHLILLPKSILLNSYAIVSCAVSHWCFYSLWLLWAKLLRSCFTSYP